MTYSTKSVEVAVKTRSRSQESRVGILLVEPPSKLVFANVEALSILSYPDPGDFSKTSRVWPASPASQTIAAMMRNPQQGSGELRSGRRRYSCNAFALSSVASKRARQLVLVSLERRPRPPLDPSHLIEKFGLTRREAELAAFLAQGLTNKEIASRMRITPNTAKTFLKLVMLKLSVPTRSGLVGKIMEQ